MNPGSNAAVLLLLVVCLGSGRAVRDLTPEEEGKLPPPAPQTVRFIREVHPLLAERCFKCHGGGKERGGLRMDTRDLLLKGGKSGPAVVIGKSKESYLIHLVSGLDEDKVMPKEGPRLTPEEIGVLRAWIDQGLEWEGSPDSAGAPKDRLARKTREVDLSLRRPGVPPLQVGLEAEGKEVNPVDLFLAPYFESRRIQPPAPVEDRLFLRRVYLDLIGLLPSPLEVKDFLADRRARKREEAVRRLLGRTRDYAEHWLSFWNDLLRNDYQGTGYIDGGRQQITAWLYQALVLNKPYDRMVAELIDPADESSGFLKGIVWRGATNASQTPAMQAAQSVSQVFMGINLKCASCHDSFVSDWTLREAYGLAGIFAEEPLEMVRCDSPTGERAPLQFLYPELGAIDPGDPLPRRRARLAEILTRKENGRLARTIVNRLWARFFGRGLVEPADEMEGQPWHSDLLDWLAADLVDHGYDLKHTMARILTSRAYAMPAVSLGGNDSEGYVFRGPAIRRMSAEQFADALNTLTGVGQTFPRAPVDFSSLADSSDPEYNLPFEAPARAFWIWGPERGETEREEETIYFHRKVAFPAAPEEAVLVGAGDDRFTLYVNGKKAASGAASTKPVLSNLLPYLVEGGNAFAVEAVNDGRSSAGLFLYLRVRSAGEVWDFGTDGAWISSSEKAEGWEKPDFVPQGSWTPAVTRGDAGAPPWSIGKKLGALVRVGADQGRFRVSLVAADRLMAAMGRPNREQVVSARSSVATTLEALELLNGSTLASWLRRGARKLCSTEPASPVEFATTLYLRALGRDPSLEELEIARALLRDPAHPPSAVDFIPRPEGVEDFLWCLTMLPEFQLIY